MVEAFCEDLGTISSFLLLIDLWVTFAMLLLCYSQQPSYLLGTKFPSLSILQHYVEFDIRTIVMLEKLLGVRSFGGSIGHLAHCQAIFLAFLGRIGLRYVVQTIAPTFLGCWALIAFALDIYFQQDDYLVLLDIVAHVKLTFLCSKLHYKYFSLVTPGCPL
jgi:hypothetical protein